MTGLLVIRYLLSKLNGVLLAPAAGGIAWLAGLGWRSLAVAAVTWFIALALYEPDPDSVPSPLRDSLRQMKELIATLQSARDEDE